MYGKKFRFSLASILKLRKHETACTQKDLARKMQDRKAQEEEVSAAEEQLAHIAPAVEKNGVIDIQFLRRLEAHKEDARMALIEARERLSVLQHEERQTRNHLLKKRSAEEALQTLHDKEKDHHFRGVEAAENKQLEEQALDNYRRQHLSNEHE